MRMAPRLVLDDWNLNCIEVTTVFAVEGCDGHVALQSVR